MSEFVSMRPFHIRSSKNDYEKRVDITSKRRFFMLLVPISWALAIYTYRSRNGVWDFVRIYTYERINSK